MPVTVVATFLLDFFNPFFFNMTKILGSIRTRRTVAQVYA